MVRSVAQTRWFTFFNIIIQRVIPRGTSNAVSYEYTFEVDDRTSSLRSSPYLIERKSLKNIKNTRLRLETRPGGSKCLRGAERSPGGPRRPRNGKISDPDVHHPSIYLARPTRCLLACVHALSVRVPCTSYQPLSKQQPVADASQSMLRSSGSGDGHPARRSLRPVRCSSNWKDRGPHYYYIGR